MTISIGSGNDELDVLPAARPAQSDAIGQLMAHAQSMHAAKQLADALCDTELVPTIYRGKPGNGAAAILYGAELGLSPIQSMQQIFVVHGSPAIYARTAVALLKSRAGIVVQTVSSTDESVTVSATDPATGQVETSTWDLKRAERAGYTGNKKYATDPQAMLYAKAAMEVARKIAPDVLLGIPYSREELELERPQEAPKKVASSRRGLDGLRAALTPAPAVIDAEESGPAEAAPVEVPQSDPNAMSQATRKKWVGAMFAALAEADCEDRDDQLTVITELAQRRGNPPEHRDGITDAELRMVVNALNAARKDGTLGQVVTEILNTAALRESGQGDGQPA